MRALRVKDLKPRPGSKWRSQVGGAQGRRGERKAEERSLQWDPIGERSDELAASQ